jgi:hypothetical protein
LCLESDHPPAPRAQQLSVAEGNIANAAEEEFIGSVIGSN